MISRDSIITSVIRIIVWVSLYLAVLYCSYEKNVTANEQFASFGVALVLIGSVCYGLITLLAGILVIFAIYGTELLFNIPAGGLYQLVFHIFMAYFSLNPIISEILITDP